ncbi:hypothetical protein FSP39_023990 [Pinctada imbricata]|uniref:Uncharacterized protein n=1 Tax=Pinctada imbricata TaxID=66713 RepID=A0AA88Y204_PINIB|nr:hypothetical protein FSP39_023990 [Pinctada imbricata]
MQQESMCYGMAKKAEVTLLVKDGKRVYNPIDVPRPLLLPSVPVTGINYPFCCLFMK